MYVFIILIQTSKKNEYLYIEYECVWKINLSQRRTTLMKANKLKAGNGKHKIP